MTAGSIVYSISNTLNISLWMQMEDLQGFLLLVVGPIPAWDMHFALWRMVRL